MNNLGIIEEILMREIKKLDDDEHMKNNSIDEIKRSQAISNTAQSYIKAKNMDIRIFELRNTYGKDFNIEG